MGAIKDCKFFGDSARNTAVGFDNHMQICSKKCVNFHSLRMICGRNFVGSVEIETTGSELDAVYILCKNCLAHKQ